LQMRVMTADEPDLPVHKPDTRPWPLHMGQLFNNFKYLTILSFKL
jgi:hypothetical protein